MTHNWRNKNNWGSRGGRQPRSLRANRIKTHYV